MDLGTRYPYQLGSNVYFFRSGLFVQLNWFRGVKLVSVSKFVSDGVRVNF